MDHLWIRVPVAVDDLSGVRRGSARVAFDATSKPNEWLSVKAAPAPPTAAAVSASVDLYFAVDNSKGTWSPGMRAIAALPLAGEDDNLVVPWSAVVHDPAGGSWVYQWVAPHTFGRRRVSVERIDGDRAVLSAGPPATSPIATAGVAELFGLDVGYAK
jgi:multidrug efflux pump subunit AcrA (membrane-fusion protein)